MKSLFPLLFLGIVTHLNAQTVTLNDLIRLSKERFELIDDYTSKNYWAYNNTLVEKSSIMPNDSDKISIWNRTANNSNETFIYYCIKKYFPFYVMYSTTIYKSYKSIVDSFEKYNFRKDKVVPLGGFIYRYYSCEKYDAGLVLREGKSMDNNEQEYTVYVYSYYGYLFYILKDVDRAVEWTKNH